MTKNTSVGNHHVGGASPFLTTEDKGTSGNRNQLTVGTNKNTDDKNYDNGTKASTNIQDKNKVLCTKTFVLNGRRVICFTVHNILNDFKFEISLILIM